MSFSKEVSSNYHKTPIEMRKKEEKWATPFNEPNERLTLPFRVEPIAAGRSEKTLCLLTIRTEFNERSGFQQRRLVFQTVITEKATRDVEVE